MAAKFKIKIIADLLNLLRLFTSYLQKTENRR